MVSTTMYSPSSEFDEDICLEKDENETLLKKVYEFLTKEKKKYIIFDGKGYINGHYTHNLFIYELKNFLVRNCTHIRSNSFSYVMNNITDFDRACLKEKYNDFKNRHPKEKFAINIKSVYLAFAPFARFFILTFSEPDTGDILECYFQNSVMFEDKDEIELYVGLGNGTICNNTNIVREIKRDFRTFSTDEKTAKKLKTRLERLKREKEKIESSIARTEELIRVQEERMKEYKEKEVSENDNLL